MDVGESTEVPEDIDKFFEKLTGDDDDDDEAIKNLEILCVFSAVFSFFPHIFVFQVIRNQTGAYRYLHS